MTETEKKKYRKNYLEQVVCQLNFASIGSIDDTTMKSYKDLLGEGYSELASISQKGIIIQNDGSNNLHTEIEDNDVWQIESSDKTHTIMVSKKSLAITFAQYVSFRKYIEIASKAHDLFFGLFTDLQQVDRLGLRYVNQVKLKAKGVSWKDYIDPRLTASLDFIEASKLRRSMHSMVIEHDDETRLNFNYGVFNQYFPAPIIENEFILDLDAYTSSAVKPTDCRRLIEKFNTAIAIYFELSVTDKLRNEMEVIEDEAKAE